MQDASPETHVKSCGPRMHPFQRSKNPSQVNLFGDKEGGGGVGLLKKLWDQTNREVFHIVSCSMETFFCRWFYSFPNQLIEKC